LPLRGDRAATLAPLRPQVAQFRAALALSAFWGCIAVIILVAVAAPELAPYRKRNPISAR
jgi:hypothetical protein